MKLREESFMKFLEEIPVEILEEVSVEILEGIPEVTPERNLVGIPVEIPGEIAGIEKYEKLLEVIKNFWVFPKKNYW